VRVKAARRAVVDPAAPLSVVEQTSKGRKAMLEIGSIVWGVRDVPRAIAFWCAALGYQPLRRPSSDRAILVPKEGKGVQLAISQVSSDAKDHQRHHLDLYASDRAAEVERLLGLGADRVDWRYPEHADYIVLADPDGNTFCVVQKNME
jgi:catechol 2,3-dioxygenase-like lactoylglutathione lyase family enzyme